MGVMQHAVDQCNRIALTWTTCRPEVAIHRRADASCSWSRFAWSASKMRTDSAHGQRTTCVQRRPLRRHRADHVRRQRPLPVPRKPGVKALPDGDSYGAGATSRRLTLEARSSPAAIIKLECIALFRPAARMAGESGVGDNAS